MHNLHQYDRLIRLVIGFVFIYLAGAEINMYLIMGFLLIATSYSNFCPIYKTLGINKKLAKQNDFYEYLPKHNPEPVFIFSKNGDILFQNDSSKEILPNITNAKDISELKPSDIIDDKKKFSVIHPYKDKIYMLEVVGIKDKSYILAYGFNITQIEKNRQKLAKQNITDSLTNLGNREKLLQDISKQENKNISLMIFDIISFSQLNSFFGHQKGDEFLKNIACELKNFGEKFNFLILPYRLRGNTFAFLINFKETEEEENIQKVKKELRIFFENFQININNITLTMEIRIGIASKCINEQNKEMCEYLLSNAETALSEAKKDNLKYLYFKDISNIHEKYKENINWANKLHNIFNGKSDAKLKAYFQPIYNLKTNKIEKYESLVRIEDNGEVISPFKFLNVAKQLNYLPKITNEVFSQALKTFKNNDLEFSINLTTQDLAQEGFLPWFCQSCDDCSIDTSSIVLEILEDEDIYEYIDKIKELKEQGFKLAIDDFGTGYSNFKKLQQLNVDYIKIDGSLVKNIASNPKDLSIIKSICAYAKAINVKTIAEFVANKEIYDLVKTTDVDFIQGYFIGQPKPELIKDKDV